MTDNKQETGISKYHPESIRDIEQIVGDWCGTETPSPSAAARASYLWHSMGWHYGEYLTDAMVDVVTVEMMMDDLATKYYRDQLESIEINGEYSPKFMIRGSSPDMLDKTKWMNLNRDSAKVLIKWLSDNINQLKDD